MHRHLLLTPAAITALILANWNNARAESDADGTQANVLAGDTTDPSNERHPTIVLGGGMLHLTHEDGFTRITIDKAKTDAEPYGYCTFENASFDAQHPVFDFWIRMSGNHSAALCMGFGQEGLGYGSGAPYAFHPHNHMLNILGTQYWPETSTLGDLGPINDGTWHHIVYDLNFAMQARLGTDLTTVGQSSLSLYDFGPATLLLAGGAAQPLPATIEFRDMVIRPRKLDDAYSNDLVLEVRSSSLGESPSGGHKYLVAGSVISRRGLEDASIILGNVDGNSSSKDLGAFQLRKEFSLIAMVLPGVSELPIKLVAGGQSLIERRLVLPPPLTYLQDATIHLIPTSHQDVAWLDTPGNTGVWRREKGIRPAIDLLEQHPDYRYGFEHTYSLMDYLNHEPFRAEAVRKLAQEGRLSFGATYNQPYQSLWGGESLLRQLYYGRKWFRENFGDDIPCLTAWNTDTPETALQLPQILAKSGVKYFMQGRFRPGLFDWYSPDGSKVTVDTLGIYGLLAPYLKPFDAVNVAVQVPELMQYWDTYYKEHKIPKEFPISDMSDFSSPTQEFIELVREWNHEARQKYESGFNIKFSTADEFMNSLTRDPETRLPSLRGEWVSQWGYIVPTQSKMVAAGREASWALTSAEKFWALRYMAAKNSEPYQKATFDEAWMSHIHFDHGPGGLNGDITDQTFYALEEKARILGQSLLNSAVRWIAERATPLDQQCLKLVVLNPLSWTRTGPTIVELPTPPGQQPEILDAEGKVLRCQRVPQTPGGTTRYVMEANDIPSIGYSTFQVRFNPDRADTFRPDEFKTRVYENDFYRLELVPGGLKSIFDKRLRIELVNANDFLGGEIFSLDSFGGDSSSLNGHGEVAQPSWERIERASQYSPNWHAIESGPVRTGWRMEQAFKEATIRVDLYAYQETKRLDFDVAILHWSGTIYKEFRMAMPVNISNGQVAYDVPYGVLEVGKDELQEAPWPGGWDDMPSYKTHPRYVQNWISAGNGDFTVALTSLASSWDYLDAHEKMDRFTLLQPILLASRHSGHPQGNYYSPPGDYHFKYALSSYAGDWRNNTRFGDEVNAPFPAVAIGSLYGWDKDRLKGRINAPQPPVPGNPQGPIGSMSSMLNKGSEPALPSSLSLCQVSAPNYVISCIKVADDQKGFIVRGYEVTGHDAPVTLNFPLAITSASATNLIEEDLPQQLNSGAGEVKFEAGHHSINALRLQGEWKP